MGAEVLTVTTSARRLWELVHRPIGHALAELDGGPHEFRLGGGTALAARWHHRDSFDVDLVVDRTVPLRELANPSNPFDLTMRALGGTPEYFRRQCTVTFSSGQVDLMQMDPVPPGAEDLAVVDGTPTHVLDTAQILHGKLERAEKIAVRDVFDFIRAAELDPHALATAVNCRSRRETEVIATTFEEANAALRRDARRQLVGAGEITDPETLGTQAAAAIRGAVYRHLRVRTEGPLGIVETTTNSGTARRIEMMLTEVERKLAESGLIEHLSAGAFGAHRIRRALDDACAHGEGDQVVWETGSRPLSDERDGRARDREI